MQMMTDLWFPGMYEITSAVMQCICNATHSSSTWHRGLSMVGLNSLSTSLLAWLHRDACSNHRLSLLLILLMTLKLAAHQTAMSCCCY